MEVRKTVRIILRLNRFLQECHKKVVCPQYIRSGATGCHFITLLIMTLIIWLRRCHLASFSTVKLLFFPFYQYFWSGYFETMQISYSSLNFHTLVLAFIDFCLSYFYDVCQVVIFQLHCSLYIFYWHFTMRKSYSFLIYLLIHLFISE